MNQGGSNSASRRPPDVLFKALDVDGDHEISAEELQNAMESLSKLDKNEDGRLSLGEINPQESKRAEKKARAREIRMRATAIAGRKPSPKEQFVNLEIARVMRFDANKDGLITASELPERMSEFLEKEDTDGNNVIDRNELEAMANRRWSGN